MNLFARYAVQDQSEPLDIEPADAGRRRLLSRLRRQKTTLCAMGFLVVIVITALFASVIAPFSPNASDISARLQGPSSVHWLGTDELGRDVLSRLIFGSRVALRASLQAVGLGMVIGIPLGLLAGYLGGAVDWVSMRALDVIQSIPMLLVAFAVVAVIGTGLTNTMIAVGIVFIADYMRLTRAVVLVQRAQLYVQAATVLGYRTRRIVFRHLLPNVTGPLIVQTSTLLGIAILIEAMLSFLGLGSEVGTASWGSMLDAARRFQNTQPLLSIVPGLMITATVLAFNLLGDGLRDLTAREMYSSKAPKLRRRQADPATSHTHRDAGVVSEAAREHVENRDQDIAPNADRILSLEHISVDFEMPSGDLATVVSDLTFNLSEGDVFGLVGESGSGKSMTSLAVLDLIPPPGVITSGAIWIDGTNLQSLDQAARRKFISQNVGIVFQDPMSSFSPVHTVGKQLCESLRSNEGLKGREALDRAAELLDRVGVPKARERLSDYPHQFSGGMAQRAAIAAALVCRPKLLIADEPTTALDATVQRQVLSLMMELKDEFGMSVLLITHDLGVIAETSTRVGVMYAGQIVEETDVSSLFRSPQHPYSAALIDAMPTSEARSGRLRAIQGAVPAPWDWPTGCRFHPRCVHAQEACAAVEPPFVNSNRCLRAEELHLRGLT